MYKTKFKKGDQVSLQSISGGMAGDPRFIHRFLTGQKRIKNLGFVPIPSKYALRGIDFIATNPKKRARDFMDAFTNNHIKMLIANIGGNDCHQIIPFLDSQTIKNNPKPIMGYSDITSLHLYLYTLGIQTYYGPSVLSGFAENHKMHPLTLKSLKNVLFKSNPQKVISSKKWTSEFLDWADKSLSLVKRNMHLENRGHIFINFTHNISGHLLGGCLDTIMEIKNQDFFPKLNFWKNAIIFLETSEQKMEPSKFARAIDLIKEEINVANGILFGKPKDEKYFDDYLEIVQKKISKPIVFNLNFGHTAPIYTIPYGGIAEIDVNKEEIIIKN